VEPIAVEVVRGATPEAVHHVHAVAVAGGRVVFAAGDPERVTYLRSSAKPIQALPVVRACPWLDDEAIALCCSSHGGRPEQLAVVDRMLEAAEATVDDLECGTGAGRRAHTCSGKHAGFLCLCHAHGWERSGYRRAAHPCQDAMLAELAEATGVARSGLVAGVDGCGIPTVAVSLRAAAESFVRLRALEGADRVVGAMTRRPELLRGPVPADGPVIERLEGWIAKGGAEGLLCASSPDGLGLALKVEDGSYRPMLAALGHVLDALGIATDFGPEPLLNARGETVGTIAVASG
jgi:L-asparaginase II